MEHNPTTLKIYHALQKNRWMTHNGLLDRRTITLMKRKVSIESVDAETLAAIDAGVKIAENGKRWTIEQAFEYARTRRKEWMKKPTDKRIA